ncbi:MAG: phosphoribosylamine--glycine ligase [Candidatus Tyrphobacter sp.]
MRVLVVGGGAREDALSWRISESASCEAVFAAPGNAGTASRGINWAIPATDGKVLARRCLEERIDLAVLGPETSIAAGVGDRLREAGVAVFGPNRSAGRLESSKIFAKRFMQRHGIPTARASVAHSLDTALRALQERGDGVAIKADGLAAGKGVVVARDLESARATLGQWYGPSRVPGGGNDVLVEDLLEGRELSLFALCDGERLVPFGAACDYKRAGDGDTGPNTGGMGAYAPPCGFPDDFESIVCERILEPLQRGLVAEGERYLGALYCGLMWTKDGPFVIEFNARFGDPEAQVLLPRIEGDFAALLRSVASGKLDADAVTFSPRSCVGIVLATSGYPAAATPIAGLRPNVALPDACRMFWGSSVLRNGAVDASGGRVLTVTATGEDLERARARAYEGVRTLSAAFGAYDLSYRTDIAKGSCLRS